jgi:hypothetical protein
MSMQTDILASTTLTASGEMKAASGTNLGRTRVRAIYVIPAGTAGSIALRDGGSGGVVKLTVNTVASATTPLYMLLPGEGMLFGDAVYADLTSVTSMMVFYA